MNGHEAEERKQLLAALRDARIRMRFVADEIDCLGIMLKHGGITIREAVNWIDDLGGSHLVADMIYRDLAQDRPPIEDQPGENHGDEKSGT